MTVTAAYLKTRFPTAFPATFSDTVLNNAILEAESRNDASEWGSQYDLAVTYMAGHLALLDAGAAASAAGITSATAGSVSVSYGSGSSGSTSQFLTEYNNLLKSRIVGFMVSG